MLAALAAAGRPRGLLCLGAARVKVDRSRSARRNHRHQSPPCRGVQIWEERIDADEITVVDGMRVTTPARTALDLARHYRRDLAVAAIDALAQAVEVKMADIELLVDRYRGRRGMKAARVALELVDGGAQSPR